MKITRIGLGYQEFDFEEASVILQKYVFEMDNSLKNPLVFGIYKDKYDPLATAFEIFCYLLFQFDYFILCTKKQVNRKDFIDYTTVRIFESLSIIDFDKKEALIKILGSRLEEYGIIQANKEYNEEQRITNRTKTFLKNLRGSIPLSGDLDILNLHNVFANTLIHSEINFRKDAVKFLKEKEDKIFNK